MGICALIYPLKMHDIFTLRYLKIINIHFSKSSNYSTHLFHHLLHIVESLAMFLWINAS